MNQSVHDFIVIIPSCMVNTFTIFFLFSSPPPPLWKLPGQEGQRGQIWGDFWRRVLSLIFFPFWFISTEGALTLPTAYDNHPSQSHPTYPIPQSLFNHLNRPWIDLSRPPMTSNALCSKGCQLKKECFTFENWFLCQFSSNLTHDFFWRRLATPKIWKNVKKKFTNINLRS